MSAYKGKRRQAWVYECALCETTTVRAGQYSDANYRLSQQAADAAVRINGWGVSQGLWYCASCLYAAKKQNTVAKATDQEATNG